MGINTRFPTFATKRTINGTGTGRRGTRVYVNLVGKSSTSSDSDGPSMTQRLLVTCIASNWPLATDFLGTMFGSQKSGNQIPVQRFYRFRASFSRFRAFFSRFRAFFDGYGPQFRPFFCGSWNQRSVTNMAGNQAGYAYGGNWKHWVTLSSSLAATETHLGHPVPIDELIENVEGQAVQCQILFQK